MELRDGTKYRGELKESIYHGNGYIVFPDKSYYKGRFEDGVYEGHGECYSASTDTLVRGYFTLGEAIGCCTLRVG